MIKDYNFFDENGKKQFLDKIEFSDCVMTFPYTAGAAIEMDDKVIVALSNSQMSREDLSKWRNIWCYLKPEQGKTEGKLLWKIAPPVNHRGEPYHLPYYTLRWNKQENAIYVANDAFGYTVDPDNGHITLVASGLR